MRPPAPYDGFWDWLEEPASDDESCSRGQVIRRFVREGLLPFLKEHGYVLGVPETQFGDWIANGLYENRNASHVGSLWTLPVPNTDWYEEDLWQFEHVLSDAVWEAFWADWSGWTDVSPESFRGLDRQQDIQALVWKCINIAKSEQTNVVNQFFTDTDDEAPGGAERRKTTDVYYQEAEGWGGYRR